MFAVTSNFIQTINNPGNVIIFNTTDTNGINTGTYFNFGTYQYSPPIAGWYQINGAVQINETSPGSYFFVSIYKNGLEFKRGSCASTGITSVTSFMSNVSSMVYLNGTDNITLYGNTQGSSVTMASSIVTYFNGYFLNNVSIN
jgi:hypothetical protein